MDDATRAAAEIMLAELRENRLEVVRVGVLRVAQSRNAAWYRSFCGAYTGRRRRFPRPRTIIRRATTEAALKRLAAGNASGVYGERLLPFVEEYAERLRSGSW